MHSGIMVDKVSTCAMVCTPQLAVFSDQTTLKLSADNSLLHEEVDVLREQLVEAKHTIASLQADLHRTEIKAEFESKRATAANQKKVRAHTVATCMKLCINCHCVLDVILYLHILYVYNTNLSGFTMVYGSHDSVPLIIIYDFAMYRLFLLKANDHDPSLQHPMMWPSMSHMYLISAWK